MKLNCLITAGPTIEKIDPVRFISNHSSGKQGYEIAKSIAEKGMTVNLVSGPTQLEAPKNVNLFNIESADEMNLKCLEIIERSNIDVAIMVAAVADFKVEEFSQHKIKKQDNIQKFSLDLVKTPDILKNISNHPNRPKLVIGFALESQDLIERAELKRQHKECDWIVANSTNNVKNNTTPFNSNSNTVFIIKDNSVTEYYDYQKTEIAQIITEKIIEELCK